MLSKTTWHTIILSRLVGIIDYPLYRAQTPNVIVLSRLFGVKSIDLRIPSSLSADNPSIIPTASGWMAIVRAHNWITSCCGRFIGFHGSDLHNENWLLTLNNDLKVIERLKLCDLSDYTTTTDEHPARNGIEDARLSEIDGDVYLTGSAYNTVTGRCTMTRARVVGDRLADVTFLRSPFQCAQEKNWMPVDIDGVMNAIYRVSPFCLLRLEGEAKVVIESTGKPHLRVYNGSSQLVPFGEGWLCLLHRRINVTRRSFRSRKNSVSGIFYVHRFIHFDRSWEIVSESGDFFFEKRGLEFCAGLARKGDRFVVSYGLNASAAKLMELCKFQIESLLSDPAQ
ncbi:hypothetical protein [Methylosinus sp. LW3]|uniref:hypothetical protein n=1 Tax=Methylosinus sp. LW3 TaxID=107635 RepID=UPI0012FC9636|nr:hypothetical protein [Methylosinus sp. LW3]